MNQSVRRNAALLPLLLLLCTSCVNTRKATYFNDVPDNLRMSVPSAVEQIVQPNDILGIQVNSPNADAASMFNTNTNTNGTPLSGTNALLPHGYLVDPQGFIQFPVLGRLQAGGLTKQQLTEQIRNHLVERKLLLDPVVSIRFLNFRVTVLGEVARPTVVPVPNEKITILEALGFAGDLTIFGKRENVLLIREENGERITKRINLNSKDLLNSPYFYLKNGDVLYAEPNRARVASATNSRQVLPIILSGLSFVAIILDMVTR